MRPAAAVAALAIAGRAAAWRTELFPNGDCSGEPTDTIVVSGDPAGALGPCLTELSAVSSAAGEIDALADEAAHARRCDAFRRGAPAARLERADARVAADVDDRTRVVEVRPTDARGLRAVVREARRTAARDLGAPTDDGGGGEDDAATAYVAVARGRAVGLCLVEPVPGAPRTMGVAAVWVLAARRRRGLGTALVDAARARFALAGPVPRRSIATTHRTRDGAAFFAAYGAGRVYAPTPG